MGDPSEKPTRLSPDHVPTTGLRDLIATMPFPVLPPTLTMKTHASLPSVPAWNALTGTGVDFSCSCWFMEPPHRLDEA